MQQHEHKAKRPCVPLAAGWHRQYVASNKCLASVCGISAELAALVTPLVAYITSQAVVANSQELCAVGEQIIKVRRGGSLDKHDI